MRRTPLLLAAALWQTLVPNPASATVYYVKTTGDDNANGRAPGTAWLTMEKAFASAISGDLVFVAPGTYQALTYFSPSGSGGQFGGIGFFADTQSIEFNGSPAPGEVRLRSNNSSYTLLVSGKSQLLFYGFTIESGNASTKLCPTSTGTANCAIYLTGDSNDNVFVNVATEGNGNDYGVVIENSWNNRFGSRNMDWSWGWLRWDYPQPGYSPPGFKGTGAGIALGPGATENEFEWVQITGKAYWSIEAFGGAWGNRLRNLSIEGGGVKIESQAIKDIWEWTITKNPAVSSTDGLLYGSADPWSEFHLGRCKVSGFDRGFASTGGQLNIHDSESLNSATYGVYLAAGGSVSRTRVSGSGTAGIYVAAGGGSTVNILGAEVVGTQGGGYGIELHGNASVELTRVEGNGGGGVYVASDSNVSRSSIKGNGGGVPTLCDGKSAGLCQNVPSYVLGDFNGNIIKGNVYGVYVMPGSPSASNLEINSNTIVGNQVGIYGDQSRQLMIRGNQIEGNTGLVVGSVRHGGISIVGSTAPGGIIANGNYVEDNYVNDNNGIGIYVFAADSSFIRRNRVIRNLSSTSTDGAGILIDSKNQFSGGETWHQSNMVYLEENAVIGSHTVGIDIGGVSAQQVWNNVVAGSDGVGIRIRSYDECVDNAKYPIGSLLNVEGNLVYANSSSGIEVIGSFNGQVLTNTISNNTGAGLKVEQTTQPNSWDGMALNCSGPSRFFTPSLRVDENIFHQNTGSGVQNLSGSIYECDRNGAFGNTGGDFDGVTCTNTLSSDPYFVRAKGVDNSFPTHDFPYYFADDNFRLRQQSPDPSPWSSYVDWGGREARYSAQDKRSTRTDGCEDTGMVDLGYHYQLTCGTLKLAAYDSNGQPSNAFVSQWQQGDEVELYRFRIQNFMQADVTVYSMKFKVESRIGMENAGPFRIVKKWGGSYAPWEGIADIEVDNSSSRSEGKIVFRGPVRINANSDAGFVLVATPKLRPLERFTISLAESDIELPFGVSMTPNTVDPPGSASHSFKSQGPAGNVVGRYYSGSNYDTFKEKRDEAQIKFTYGNDGLWPSSVSPPFTARWDGAFWMPCNGNAKLFVNGEGGMRVRAGWPANPDVDSWNTVLSPEQEVSLVGLKQGWYPFQIEYKEEAAPREMVVSYESNDCGIAKTEIPSAALAPIPDPEDMESPDVGFWCGGQGGQWWSNWDSYWVTDQSVTAQFWTSETTTSRLYYKKSSDSTYRYVDDNSQSQWHAVTVSGLSQNTEYDFYVEATDLAGNTSSAPLSWNGPRVLEPCRAATWSAPSWCEGGPYVTMWQVAGDPASVPPGEPWSVWLSESWMLGDGEILNFGQSPSPFWMLGEPGGPSAFFVRVGDISGGARSAAVRHSAAGPCDYSIAHDDGLYWRVGSQVLENTTSAGTATRSLSWTGYEEWEIRTSNAAGLWQLQVKRLCPGDSEAKPIPKEDWGIYCDPNDFTAPEIREARFNAFFGADGWVELELNEPGRVRVEYGTASKVYTSCSGDCNPTSKQNAAWWFSIGLLDLTPSTWYYGRAVVTDLRGNETVTEERAFKSSPPPPIVSGGLSYIYCNDPNLTCMGMSSYGIPFLPNQMEGPIDFTEQDGVWPRSPIPSDGYSVIWGGLVNIPDQCHLQPVTFYFTSRDGGIIYLTDGDNVIDWSLQSTPKELKITRTFSRGWHPLGVGMFNYTDQGRAKLEWSAGPGASNECGAVIPRQVIPAASLAQDPTANGWDWIPPEIVKTCEAPPAGGHVCSTPNQLDIKANDSCVSPDLLEGPTTDVSDNVTPSSSIVRCWRPTTPNDCLGAQGFPQNVPFGASVVAFRAIDQKGNYSDQNLDVRLVDLTKPTLTLSDKPARPPVISPNPPGCDITLDATGGTTLTVNPTDYFDATVTDNCTTGISPGLPGTIEIPAGGVATATWTAIDGSNNSTSVSVRFCTRDGTGPIVDVSPWGATDCRGLLTETWLPDPLIWDDGAQCLSPPCFVYQLPDGGPVQRYGGGELQPGERNAALPFGVTMVRVKAWDDVPNFGYSVSIPIEVNDTTPPSVLLDSMSPSFDALPFGVTNAASVESRFKVSDSCVGTALLQPPTHTGSGTATWDAGPGAESGDYVVTTTAEGFHKIAVSATDPSGQTGEGYSKVIIDRAPPVVLTTTITSRNPNAPDWIYYTTAMKPPTFSIIDEADAGATAGVFGAMIDIWKPSGEPVIDAGQNVVVMAVPGSPVVVRSATKETSKGPVKGSMGFGDCQPGEICGEMCVNPSVDGVCRDTLAGWKWDNTRLVMAGNYELWLSTVDLGMNWAEGSVLVEPDAGPGFDRYARKYYFKLARLSHAIQEAFALGADLTDAGGTPEFGGAVAVMNTLVWKMGQAWSFEKGFDRGAEFGDPYVAVPSVDLNYEPWETLAAPRGVVLRDVVKRNNNMRLRQLETMIDLLDSYYSFAELAVSYGATDEQRQAIRMSKMHLARTLIAEAELGCQRLAALGFDSTNFQRWGDFQSTAAEVAENAHNMVSDPISTTNHTLGLQRARRAIKLCLKLEHEYETPFSTEQFALHPAASPYALSRRFPMQVAVETNTSKHRQLLMRLTAEEKARAELDAGFGFESSRRIAGLSSSGVPGQHWPPLLRDMTGEPSNVQYTALERGADWLGRFPYVGPPGSDASAYIPTGADAGETVRFVSTQSFIDTVGAFRACRRVQGGPAQGTCPAGEVCVLYDSARYLAGGLPNASCDPMSGTYQSGYLPGVTVLSDGGVIKGNQYGWDALWMCPGNGYCTALADSGPDGGKVRPGALQRGLSLIGLAEVLERFKEKVYGISLSLEGLALLITAEIFSLSQSAAALLCPQALTNGSVCLSDDAGAETIPSLCAGSGIAPGRCEKMVGLRNSLKGQWREALQYLFACYDATLADCPDPDAGNCICSVSPALNECPVGATTTAGCCVRECDPVTALTYMTNNLCRFQDVINLAYQYPRSGDNTQYYRIPNLGTGGLNCPPTTGGEPTPPANLVASPRDKEVALNWNAPSGTVTGYRVYQGTVTGVTRTGALVASPTVTNATIQGLTNGTNYFFVVTAVNGYGESIESNEASATPDELPPDAAVDAGRPYVWQFGTASTDTASGVAVDSTGNIYLALNSADLYVRKISPTGDTLWNQQGGTLIAGLAANTGGTTAVMRRIFPSEAFEVAVEKWTSGGTLEWSRQPGVNANGVAIDPSGNIFLTGQTAAGVFAVKYSAAGVKEWTQPVTAGTIDEGWAVSTDSAGNAYVTGARIPSPGSFACAFVAKLTSSTGATEWITDYCTAFASSYGKGILVDTGGNVFVTGHTFGPLEGNPQGGSGDAFFAKLTSTGSKVWTRQSGGPWFESGTGVAVDTSGDAYFLGSGQIVSGSSYDVAVVKYSSSGGWSCMASLSGTASTDAVGIAVEPSGNVLIVGNTWGAIGGNTNLGASDVFIARYSPTCELLPF